MDIGAICNNASLVKNEDGVYVGQSTDVALLNVLSLFGLPDRRDVRFTVFNVDAVLVLISLNLRPSNA